LTHEELIDNIRNYIRTKQDKWEIEYQKALSEYKEQRKK